MNANPLAMLELVIGRLFRTGMIISAIALIAGLVLWVAHSSLATPLLLSGLVVLMAVPAARVLASSIDALRRRDTLLIAATLAVIVELIWLFVSKR